MRRRPPLERLQAWWITGPLGHLQAGLADAGQLVWLLARVRARELSAGSGRRIARRHR